MVYKSKYNYIPGIKRYYFHGNDTGEHTCKCGYENSCDIAFDMAFKCNCDAALPLETRDNGLITDMRQLPITSFVYGPIRTNLGKSAKIKIGPLICKGKRPDITNEVKRGCENSNALRENEVYFAVERGCKNDGNLKAGGTITYDEIFVDTHDKFNISSGIFRAPATGIYVFQFSAHKSYRSATKAYVQMYINDIGKNEFGVNTGKETTAIVGNHWYESLLKGDQIRLQVSSGSIAVSCSYPVTFSGHFIAPKS